MTFELPSLDYEYDALEPFIDAKTMEIHHSKHHASYVDKFNKALEGHDDLQSKNAEELVSDLGSLPEDVKKAVQNAGGGHVNHTFFWQILGKDVECGGKIAKMIDKEFGSFDKFKSEFSEASAGLFGSGWCWLVEDSDKLEIMTTQNQDSPLSIGKKPLLCIDVWEHAYYLKYQNKRPDYIESFFSVINWDKVNENLEKS